VPEAIAEARPPSIGVAHLAKPGIRFELAMAYVTGEGRNRL
jgi:hypothetical protein